jgi:vacuolar-type H+-ATPase subunit I/STV1
VTIGLFSIVVVWHVLPLWVWTLLRRYDDTFSTNVCVKIIVTLYIGIYAIYYARIRGGWQSYRRIVVKKNISIRRTFFPVTMTLTVEFGDDSPSSS